MQNNAADDAEEFELEGMTLPRFWRGLEGGLQLGDMRLDDMIAIRQGYHMGGSMIRTMRVLLLGTV